MTHTPHSDPNIPQRNASDPSITAWVSASAGSGKTSVLTSRILRLLLPNTHHFPAADPSRILCLTFTKTGAGEMQAKLMARVRQWVTASPDNLTTDLTNLFGYAPNPAQMLAARGLFAKLLDVPGGLKIITIHSLCLSILARFPLEAKLSPGFRLLEEGPELDRLLTQARHHILKNPPLAPHKFQKLINAFSPDTFIDHLTNFIHKRITWNRTKNKQHGFANALQNFAAELQIDPQETIETILSSFVGAIPPDTWQTLKTALIAIDNGTAIKMANNINLALAMPDIRDQFTALKASILTKNNTPWKQGLKSLNAANTDLFIHCADTLILCDTKIKTLELYETMRDLCILGDAYLNNFQHLKMQAGVLDNDDLITMTAELLKNTDSAWVHYKLDGGIDHVLVDEAQDTSPDQWDIITALTKPFFEDTTDTQRSLFVVGDEKQSIFSFQNAAPWLFQETRAFIAKQAEIIQKPFKDVPLHTSFRSSPIVLDFVDSVFAQPDAKNGLFANADNPDALYHTAHLHNMPGSIALWPRYIQPPKPKVADSVEADWNVKLTARSHINAQHILVDDLCNTIADWLKNGLTIGDHRRPIKPGDIMILLRFRKPFAAKFVRALKLRNIPVDGLDRLRLHEVLAVQDVLSAIAFGLTPTDNYTLAALLCSPLCGLSELDLETLCTTRGQSCVWDHLQTITAHAPIVTWLKQLIVLAQQGISAACVAHILDNPCPGHALNGLQALQARLGLDCAEPLSILLSEASKHDAQNQGGVWAFLHAIQTQKKDIKRQQDEASGAIRVMTIHGSKGLQAPIVILPDTIRTAGGDKKRSDGIWWPNGTGLSLPILKPSTDTKLSILNAAYAKHEKLSEDEYRRLLYVALTRAEDHLLIAGTSKPESENAKDTPAQFDWYSAATNGFATLATNPAYQTTTTPVPTSLLFGDHAHIKHIYLPGAGIRQTKPATHQQHHTSDAPAEWLFKPVPAVTPIAPLLSPSKATQQAKILSPLQGSQNRRFRRGVVIHTCLQYLPQLPCETWPEALNAYLDTQAADMSLTQRHEIAATVLQTLNDPLVIPLFNLNSRAEVPLSGHVTWQGQIIPVSGQIDRLCVADGVVHILDYKTNRPAPVEPPESYILQMTLYRLLLQKIYPQHVIKCYLLWTDGPRLQTIT